MSTTGWLLPLMVSVFLFKTNIASSTAKLIWPQKIYLNGLHDIAIQSSLPDR